LVHLTARFAWHDNKWNGTVCKEPTKNIYCRGNYSLLSPRIQRRIRLDIEEAHKKEEIGEIIKREGYLPPCYWCINAFGETKGKIADPHPFSDISTYQSRFARVPPLEDDLGKYSAFTWYFRLGFSDFEDEQYAPREELNSRVKQYQENLDVGETIVFCYANYSNPVSGNDYRYLLIGVGILSDIQFPKEYDIPNDVMDSVSAPQRMRNFPKLAWQFRIGLDKDSCFIMPYQEYLDYIYSLPVDERSDKWEELNDIAAVIKDKTIIPHFKYVSRHLPHDKAIYLLYTIKQKIERMKKHGIVDYTEVANIESKVDKLLSKAWSIRGRYPGFKNIIYQFLKHDFGQKTEDVASLLTNTIVKEYESIDNFLKKKAKKSPSENAEIVKKAYRLVSDNLDKITFLSQFDFTRKQFENVLQLLREIGIETAKRNPYLIVERYYFDQTDECRLEDSDYGIALYQFDIALIPDLNFVGWSTDYDSQSPERLRAVIREILTDTALTEGSTYLTRSDILKHIEDYPLYYINDKLKVDIDKLLSYEQTRTFKDLFLIQQQIGKDDAIYQLKALREIENIIETFLDKMYVKTYALTDEDRSALRKTVEDEKKLYGKRLLEDERHRLYNNVFKSGFFVLTGKAGSGKTSAVVNIVSKLLADKKYPIYVFTPTGKANLVIKKRLTDRNIRLGNQIRVSTIHRFLFTALFETGYTKQFGEVHELRNQVEKMLNGKVDLIFGFKELSKKWQFNPRAIIIDECSMVDELVLALLFCFINYSSLEHLIIVGDERQLPPIGIGKPLVDIIYNSKKRGLEDKTIRLESSLRFESNSSLGLLSEQFGGDDLPFPSEISEALNATGGNLKVQYFSCNNIDSQFKDILCGIGSVNKEEDIFEMFGDIFEEKGGIDLDRVQIITPRRVGDFSSEDLNLRVISKGNFSASPRTKLICEENLYHDIYQKGIKKRVLGLANGSIGYVIDRNEIYFDDLEDLKQDYGEEAIQSLIYRIRSEIHTTSKIERKINLGYSITIHKSQGSDFEYVLLVIPEKSSFITKELLYTAFTRAREKLFLLVHEGLKDDLPFILSQSYENSTLTKRNTMLFGYKTSAFKPYAFTKKNGEVIEVGSKIELIMAKALDDNDIKYVYEPEDFYQEYRIWPDFKVLLDERQYYIEHLGDMEHISYRERWNKKWQKYQQLGITDIVITTAESKDKSDVNANMKKLIGDMRTGSLKSTKGCPSNHHYEI
jgi:exodeoxyribonuclease V alpha subunit